MSQLDLDHIAALVDTIGRDRLLVLLERFALDTARLVETIETERDAGDTRGLAEAAHRLAGMAALFGGVGLTEAARAVESRTHERDLEAAVVRLRQSAELTVMSLRRQLGLTDTPLH